MSNDSLGDRMKSYEGVASGELMRRTPVIIRIDGKAFHTFTVGCDKPFDRDLSHAMLVTTLMLCSQIQGAVFGYTQSDEISILLQDWATFETDRWYGYKVQKMASVAASIATAQFNNLYQHPQKRGPALFDARVFNVPFQEVTNYFIWRQQDATRNSIQGLAQANFSHKSLQGLNASKLQDRLMLEKGINWNDIPTRFKRGSCVRTELVEDGQQSTLVMDDECPIFTQDRGYVEQMLSIKIEQAIMAEVAEAS